jgi:hypothetical protein
MSDFKTGDRIDIADVDDGNERVFLAEYGGKSYYVNTDTGAAYPVRTCDVSAYVPPAPPFPFKVGDRLRVKTGTNTVYTIMHIADGTMYLAYWSPIANETRNDSALVDSAEAWELVEAEPAPTYTHEGVVYDLNAAYRDCQGDVWRFTDRLPDSGVPWMVCAEGPTKEPLDIVVDIWGPLTRV